MVVPAGKACQGHLVLALLRGTLAAEEGLLEALALLEHRSQALAHDPFFGVREAAKPSTDREGLL